LTDVATAAAAAAAEAADVSAATAAEDSAHLPQRGNLDTSTEEEAAAAAAVVSLMQPFWRTKEATGANQRFLFYKGEWNLLLF